MSFWERFSPDTVRYYPIEEDQRYWWEMRSPSFRDEKELLRLNRELGEKWTIFDVMANELTCTFVATTIPHPDSPVEVDEEGFRPLLRGRASQKEMIQALDFLPSDVVMEMWEKMKDVAPHWGPKRGDGGETGGDGGQPEGLPPEERDGEPDA